MDSTAGETEERNTGTVQSVERALDILYSFSVDQPLLSAADLRKKLGLSRPTVYRLLDTLIKKGAVKAVGKPQKFALDVGLARLAHAWFAQVDVTDAARPIVTEVWEASRETVAIFVPKGDQRLCILELPSRHALAVTRGVGDIGPVWMGASGKAILAHASEPALEALFRSLPATVDSKGLRSELEKVRENGFAVSHSEISGGAVGIAAPFFDYRGLVGGSLGVFGPEARLGPDGMAKSTELVTRAAARLSEELGYRGPV